MILREPWNGGIGEYLENFYTAGTIVVQNGVVFSLDSGNVTFNDGLEKGVLLTPGLWDLQGILNVQGAATTTSSLATVFLATAIGTGVTGADAWRNEVQYGQFTGAPGGLSAPARSIISTQVFRTLVKPGTTQTWYCKAAILFATSTMAATGGIRATKVGYV